MYSNNEYSYNNINNINNYSKEYIPTYKILAIYQKILRSLEENLITFISSKTGSGKSTQVPKYLYEYLINEKKKSNFKIICSEPRSIACESISKYVFSKNPLYKLFK